MKSQPVTIKVASFLTFLDLTVGLFVWLIFAWGISSLCWFQVSAICLTFPRMSSDLSSLASRSDAVSLKTGPSIRLASATGLTADKHPVNEKGLSYPVAPTEFVARNASDTPLLSNRSDLLSGLRDMPSHFLDRKELPAKMPKCLLRTA